MEVARCRLSVKTIWLTASSASLLIFHKSTKRLQVFSPTRRCLKARVSKFGCELIVVHYSGARRKANSETDHDRWAFPIVFFREHKSRRGAREVAVVFEHLISALDLGRVSCEV